MLFSCYLKFIIMLSLRIYFQALRVELCPLLPIPSYFPHSGCDLLWKWGICRCNSLRWSHTGMMWDLIQQVCVLMKMGNLTNFSLNLPSYSSGFSMILICFSSWTNPIVLLCTLHLFFRLLPPSSLLSIFITSHPGAHWFYPQLLLFCCQGLPLSF